MTHPSKRKGNEFERELVRAAEAAGLDAKRAYASNGESLGYAAEVDCLIGTLLIQAKRRGKLPAYLAVPQGCDAVVFRQDRGAAMVLMDYHLLLEMLATIMADSE